MASFETLPAHLALELGTFLADSAQDILNLSLASKTLNALFGPLICHTIDISTSAKHLIPIARKILTKPEVANQVRIIRSVALPDTSSEAPKTAWPDDSALDDTIWSHLDFVQGDDRKHCFDAIRDGSRHDLLLMLLLTRTPRLELLDIGAMGPRDNRLTRLIFQHAAQSLKKLTQVVFGSTPRTPQNWYGDVPRPDYDCSYSLFADLFNLPSLTGLKAFAIAPFLPFNLEEHGLPGQDSNELFDFMLEIPQSQSLKTLRLSEMFGANKAHLGHLLKQCSSVEELVFLPTVDTYMEPGTYGGQGRFSADVFSESLAQGAHSLKRLTLQDCLFHDEATFFDARARVDFSKLHQLKYVCLDESSWLFCGEDIGIPDPPVASEEFRLNRFPNMLPKSIEVVEFNAETGGYEPLDAGIAVGIHGLFKRHADAVPNLRLFILRNLHSRKTLKTYKAGLDAAVAAGVQVLLQTKDTGLELFEW